MNVPINVNSFFAGFIGDVFGKPVEAVKVKRLATGDEYCEFKI